MDTQLIKAASRTRQVNEYYFSAKLAEIARMRQEGADVINLGIGSPDMAPAQEVIMEMSRNASTASNHGYQGYRGIPSLRQAFAEWYRRYFGVTLDPSGEILPLMGSKEGIMHISMAFLDPGDEVLVPDPGYPAYSAAALLAGGRVRKYDLAEGNGWMPDIGAIEAGGVDRVKIMWINYPHMPTGAKATPALFEQLVGFALKHRILLCNDNPYSFILNEHPISMLSVPGAKDICIELNSMSKAHNMPGWRMAMLASNAQFVQWVLKVKSNIDSGQFKPMQYAAVAALAAPKEWYDNMNRVYRSRRDLAGQIMNALGCEFSKEQVGMFLWGKIPADIESSEALANKVLYDANIFITPGFIFGSCGERYIRISLCCKNEVLQEALNRIKKIIK